MYSFLSHPLNASYSVLTLKFVLFLLIFLQDAYYKKEEVKLRFMNAMHSIAKVSVKDLATAFDLSMFKTACDVGGTLVQCFY